MNEMIGCCGLNCSKCGAYIATQTDDDAKREEVAREWTESHGGHFTADQINCDGCQTHGRAPDWVASMCPIRICCKGKEMQTCAACDNYLCDELQSFVEGVTEMKSNLKRLRT